jgi:hypothetical protein
MVSNNIGSVASLEAREKGPAGSLPSNSIILSKAEGIP